MYRPSDWHDVVKTQPRSSAAEYGYEVRYGSGSTSSSVYNAAGPAAASLMWDAATASTSAALAAHHYPAVAAHDAFAAAAAAALPLHDLWHNPFRSPCVMGHRYVRHG